MRLVMSSRLSQPAGGCGTLRSSAAPVGGIAVINAQSSFPVTTHPAYTRRRFSIRPAARRSSPYALLRPPGRRFRPQNSQIQLFGSSASPGANGSSSTGGRGRRRKRRCRPKAAVALNLQPGADNIPVPSAAMPSRSANAGANNVGWCLAAHTCRCWRRCTSCSQTAQPPCSPQPACAVLPYCCLRMP